ncbi:MAG TPA: hypothetical protein VFS05_14430 [Gemmatimonadaceae bacterium]|nr:hypothetical protein [Gemmatimonadaceae bacterium]
MVELDLSQREHDLFVQCVADAHEALRLLPGVDENGPVLMWLADHLLEAHRRSEHRRSEQAVP